MKLSEIQSSFSPTRVELYPLVLVLILALFMEADILDTGLIIHFIDLLLRQSIPELKKLFHLFLVNFDLHDIRSYMRYNNGVICSTGNLCRSLGRDTLAIAAEQCVLGRPLLPS